MFIGRFLSVAVAFTLAILMCGSAFGQQKAIAETSNDGGSVSWRVLVPHESVTLTVSMPDGTVFRREFKSGTNPVFSLTNGKGEFCGDGSFTYELVITPEISADVREEMLASRENGDSDAVAAKLKKRGLLPEAASETGAFRLLGGQLFTKEDPGVDTAEPEPFRGGADPGTPRMNGDTKTPKTEGTSSLAAGDFVINDDLIVTGSICIGFDCVNGESFSFDTLRLKENNLRINFRDTSSTSNFPSDDWNIVANDSSNGGGNYLAIQNADAGQFAFRVFDDAGANGLILKSGNAGFGTATPSADLHTVSGNSPALRLEQNGSQGFTSQTWDVAGNEADFYVRDVTNGLRKPFRIERGAPTDSVYINAGGNTGFGSISVSDGGNGYTRFIDVRAAAAGGSAAAIVDAGIGGFSEFLMQENNTNRWSFGYAGNDTDYFYIFNYTNSREDLRIDNATGRVNIFNGLTVTGGCTGCDAVLGPDWPLETIEEHSRLMYRNSYLPGVGPTPEGKSQMDVFQKVTGILQELEKAHIYIDQLNTRLTEVDLLKEQLRDVDLLKKQLSDKEIELAEMRARLERLEKLVEAKDRL